MVRIVIGHGLNTMQSGNRAVVYFRTLASPIIQYMHLNGIA
jgi:hypothetical protein